MALFVDSSALVKAYIREPGTDVMLEVLNRPELDEAVFISHTVALETFGCFARKLRGGEITEAGFSHAWAELSDDLRGGYGIVEHTYELVVSAATLMHVHRARSVGAVDWLHVSTALHLASVLVQDLAPLVFVASDARLLEVADTRGLLTFDPASHDLKHLLATLTGGLFAPDGDE